MSIAHESVQLLTVAEMANYLRVSKRSIFNYIRQGYILPVCIGGRKKIGRVLIPKEELNRLLTKTQKE